MTLPSPTQIANPSFEQFRHECLARFECHLDAVLPPPTAPLNEAMRYAVLGGGKRVRPLIIFAISGVSADTLNAACAVELMHCYSLVHDDLPCMDNDDERRNKPTCHKKYGEAMAMLVGDCLQSLAFATLPTIPPATQLLATAAGYQGMGGGQALDIDNSATTLAEISQIHQLKTGRLFRCAVQLAMLCQTDTNASDTTDTNAANASPPPDTLNSLLTFAHHFGLLFQIANDISDAQQDQIAQKNTFATVPNGNPHQHAAQAKTAALAAIGDNFPHLAHLCHLVY